MAGAVGNKSDLAKSYHVTRRELLPRLKSLAEGAHDCGVLWVVQAIVGSRAQWFAQQILALIEADGLHADPGPAGEFPDTHDGYDRRSGRFPTAKNCPRRLGHLEIEQSATRVILSEYPLSLAKEEASRRTPRKHALRRS